MQDPVSQFQVVSPPFACGVTWLINALLHLDIRATNTGFEPGHWVQEDRASVIGERALSHLKWHLPILHARQSFVFRENIDVTWEHRLDFAQRGPVPTILFVRDPRDAVHSLYRRNRAHEIDFESYLKTEDTWPDHFPGLFHLPPLETFAYFAWFWLAMGRSMPVEVVRFEDAKAAPFETLRSILGFLGVQRSDARIAQALESSSFDSARQAMERMEQLTGTEFKAVRKGQVGEWKKAYSEAALAGLGPAALAILDPLGYESPAPRCASPPVFEDCRRLIDRSMPAELSTAVGNLLNQVEQARPLATAKILGIATLDLSAPALLQLAAVMQAIDFVQKIFADTSSEQARIALNTFVNLNLALLGDAPIRSAALTLLRNFLDQARSQISDGAPPPQPGSAGAPALPG